VGLVKIAFVSS